MKRMIDSELIEPLRTDIKFDGMGNVTVGNNLEVGGKTKLNGGLKPIHEYNLGNDNKLQVLFEEEDLASGPNTFTGIGYIVDEVNSIVPCMFYCEIENGGIVEDSFDAIDCFGNTYKLSNGVQFTNISDELSKKQAKLYRHVLSLSNNSFMYSGYIVYISTSNLKVASLEDLTTLLKPSKNYTYPLTGTCTGLDTRDAIQFGSKNLYIKSFDKISYENNTWYFKDNYGDTEALDSVSDTVTPL